MKDNELAAKALIETGKHMEELFKRKQENSKKATKWGTQCLIVHYVDYGVFCDYFAEVERQKRGAAGKAYEDHTIKIDRYNGMYMLVTRDPYYQGNSKVISLMDIREIK